MISALGEELPLREAVRRGNAIGAIQLGFPGDNEGLPDRETLALFERDHRDPAKGGISWKPCLNSCGGSGCCRSSGSKRPPRALPLAEALAAGGLPAAEITFRTPAAADAIRLIAGRMPAVCILAGTVLTVEQARAAVEAGARGIVSPGTNPDVVAWCMNHGVPVIPGCATPSEVEACIRMGLGYRQALSRRSARWGGHAAGAWRGPYGQMRFMPTGGIGSGIWPPI